MAIPPKKKLTPAQQKAVNYAANMTPEQQLKSMPRARLTSKPHGPLGIAADYMGYSVLAQDEKKWQEEYPKPKGVTYAQQVAKDRAKDKAERDKEQRAETAYWKTVPPKTRKAVVMKDNLRWQDEAIQFSKKAHPFPQVAVQKRDAEIARLKKQINSLKATPSKPIAKPAIKPKRKI